MTLIELMIVVTIIATIASIGSTMYGGALLNARFMKAKQELRIISKDIAEWQARNGWIIPETLYQVGHGGRVDPWGFPYMYLNFATGTGSGMRYVTEAGIVDPIGVSRLRGGGGGIGVVRIAPDEVTPLTKVQVDTLKRKDRFLFPLNSDYDLFSVGPNGISLAALTDLKSLDDVIRADDGQFFGRAKDY